MHRNVDRRHTTADDNHAPAYRQICLGLGLAQPGDVVHGIQNAVCIFVRKSELINAAEPEGEKHGSKFFA